MLSRLHRTALVLIAALAVPITFTPVKAAPTTAPAPVIVDLVDPQSALGSYFKAQKANDLATLNKIITITNPDKKNYVDNMQTYQLWARYLERQSIAKFGKDDGLSVQAHLRSLDDQSDLDIKRALEANLEYNTEKTTAKAFLRLEKNRPDNLQTDRFQFLDVYYLIKTKDGWKIDYLKTYKCDDPDKADDYKSEMAAYPRMSRNLRSLSEQVKAGKFKSADDVKNTLETLWSKVYDEPTDASGRTAAETQADSKDNAPKKDQ